MPDNMWLKLRDVNLSLVTTTAPTDELATTRRLNDIFLTGSGGQPMGFDEWSAFYNAFEVRGSSIKLTVTNNVESNVRIAIYPAISSTAAVGYGTILEQPYVKVGTCGSLNGRNTTILKSYMSVKRLEGRQIDSVNYIGTTSASPALVRFWHIYFASMLATTALNLNVNFEVVYYVRLFRRNILAGS